MIHAQSIIEKYDQRAKAADSLVCVGLDVSLDRVPERFKAEAAPLFAFNRWIIEQTHDLVAAYKPNIAFYEAYGEQGLHELHMTVDYLREQHPDIVTICDAKRADIGSTNGGYVSAIFDRMGFDAVTLHPYLGGEALSPFLERRDKACIILCRTSNPGSGELQNLMVNNHPFWQVIAEQVRDRWNANDNCMLVMGATYPEEIRQVRQIVGDMTLLVPGIGAQGGSVEQTVRFGVNSDKRGLIINSSRGVIYAEDPRQSALELREAINQFR